MYIIKMIQQMLILLLLLVVGSGRTFENIIAIQQRNQVYTSYIPYLQSCTYDQPNIHPGKTHFIQLNDSSLFDKMRDEVDYAFWAVVRNGLDIMLVGNQLAQGYDGYMFYNSPLLQAQNRQFLLYDINGSSLTLYQAIATINMSFMKLNVTTFSKSQLSFENITDLDCQISQTQLLYFNDSSFLYLCKTDGNGFTFTYEIGEGNMRNIITYQVNLSSHGIDTPVLDGIVNPNFIDSIINDPLSFGFTWNVMLLSWDQQNNKSQSYFTTFNASSQEFDYVSFEHIKIQLNVILDRLWGANENIQEDREELAYNQIRQSMNLFFPGAIISVYIDKLGNFYVESESGNTTYLNIFDENGDQMANVSYHGYIVYYGLNDIFLYDNENQQYYRFEFQRPIFTIFAGNNQTNLSTEVNVTIPCQDMEDITLNYQILWTSPDYPSAQIYPLDSEQMITNKNIYVFQLTERFLPIGPAFYIYVNATPSIDVTIIDSSIISVTTQATTLIDVTIIEAALVVISRIIYAGPNALYIMNQQAQNRESIVQFKSPCGLGSIWQGLKVKDGYLIKDLSGKQCFCNQLLTQCHIVSNNDVAVLMGSSFKKFDKEYKEYIGRKNLFGSSYTPETYIKQNLFGLLHKDILVTILTNNTVLLIDLNTKQTLSYIDMKCQDENETMARIYFRKFYDPIILLFCYEDTAITQYIIRDRIFVFERIIPIYGFKTKNSYSSFLMGDNFAYLAVDLSVPVAPMADSCCVIRMDPCEYTVSVMKEIIFAKNVKGVISKNTVDIALYSQFDGIQSPNFFKIYFQNTFVGLNQTEKGIKEVPEEIQIVFLSSFYNFGAMFTDTVFFNFTEYRLLSKNSQMAYDVLELNKTQNTFGSPIYEGQFAYNYNKLCGPVFRTVFLKNDTNQTFFSFDIDNIVSPNKILGEIGSFFLQLINPAIYHIENLTLNLLIIVVSEDHFYIYQKQGASIDMNFVTKMQLPQTSCTYNIYKQVNTTSAIFVSDCESPNFDSLTPTILLTYIDHQIYYEFDVLFSPKQLRDIFTVVRQGYQTLIIGISEGPMKSTTGRLYLCGVLECAPLYVSSQFIFLLNYDSDVDGDSFVIMSIDPLKIEVFLSPLVNNPSKINSNYSFYYSNATEGEMCSVIKILDFTQEDAEIVLSCSKKYYQLKIQYETGIFTLYNTFIRFRQCSVLDHFKPYVITDQSRKMRAMVAVCNEDQATLKLQLFQTINSSDIVIFNGYLQIFSFQGPLCAQNQYDTIKIIPLSTSLTNRLFMVYYVRNQVKLIYSQINGILIDNFFALVPTLYISYVPTTKLIQFPWLTVQVENPYNNFYEYLETSYVAPFAPTYLNYLIFSAYCFINLITLLCLICFLISKSKLTRKVTVYRESNATELEYQDTLKAMMERLQNQQRHTIKQRQKSSRFTEIELFYIKKK